MSKPKIGIVIGTTREGRFGDKPAIWFLDIAAKRSDMNFELVDLRDYKLPLFKEARSPAYAPPDDEAALRWGAKMAELDGFVFITAEYNRSVSGELKNALDHAYKEYNRKPAAFVGYGGVGGARAIEHLRLICVELQIAPTRSGVHIAFDVMMPVMQGQKQLADFEFLNASAEVLLNDLAWWTKALKAAREQG